MRSLVSGLHWVGRIANLSLGGCLMQLDDTGSFRRDERLEMTFCVRQLPVRVQGYVRQIHPGCAVGIEFTLMSDRGSRQLLDLIRELGEVMQDQMEALTFVKKDPGTKNPHQLQRIRR